MKFKCLTENLKENLNNAELFTGKNLDLPVLSCILLEAENNFLKISSTNINLAFKSEIPINMQESGRVAVNGALIARAVSNIKDKDVDIVLEGNVLKISSEKNNIEINTVDHSDFPTILDIDSMDEPGQLVKLKSKDFVDGLNSTSYAISKSSIKPELASVYFWTKDESGIFAGTDGFRLAEKVIKLSEGNQPEVSMLIPGDSVNIISKIISTLDNQDLEVYNFGKHFFLKNNNFTIFSRLTEGDYVDYQKLIPEDTETSIIILKQDFLEISKLVNLFSDDFNQIKIKVSNFNVTIETENKFGKNKNIIDAVVSGNDLEMSFNHKNILDAFGSIHTDSVEFIFNTGKPLLIKAVGDKSFRYIVMPLSK